jgi:hypothetical protein
MVLYLENKKIYQMKEITYLRLVYFFPLLEYWLALHVKDNALAF